MNRNYITILFFLTCLNLFSQVNQKKQNKIYHSGQEVPTIITTEDKKTIVSSNAEHYLRTELGLKEYERFELIKNFNDKRGFNYKKYQLKINNIIVLGAEYTVHIRENRIVKMSGHYYNIIPQKVEITEKQAKERAINNISKAISYISEPELVYYNTTVNLKKINYVLSYRIDIYLKNSTSREQYIIDANNGDIIRKIPLTYGIQQEAKGLSHFYDTLNIITEQIGTDSYILRDYTRGDGIFTFKYSGSGGLDETGDDYTNSDTLWNLTNVEMDESAIDVHWNAEMTYDYYLNQHGRNSYDDNGGMIKNYVNAPISGAVCSPGTTTDACIYVGIDNYPWASLDICAHEFTHALTNNTAQLQYEYESGSLNESFSDIFGNTVEHYNLASASWLLGEDTGDPIRSMGNPKTFNQPDTYLGENYWLSAGDNGGVHTNSGIQNFWYYLLVEGGIGVNDNGETYDLSGIGWENAEQIAFRNLTIYLTSTSDFEDAAIFSLQAAEDLFGLCSPEYVTTQNAWHAVGVLTKLDAEVNIDFTADLSYACELPVNVQFHSSSSAGSSFFWDFGDGSTSTEANPIHQFTTDEDFNITLSTIMNNTCYSDTEEIMRTITIPVLGTLNTPSCIPDVLAPLYNVGITKVKLNSLVYESSISSSEYFDYSCETNTILHIDSIYNIEVGTGSSTSENVKVWIDYNNNGDLEPNELSFVSFDVIGTHSGQLDFVNMNPVFNTPLRLRVISDASSNTNFTSCSGIYNGEVEDYSIILIDNYNDPFIPTLVQNNNTEINQFSIYPNPANNIINIFSNNEYKIDEVLLYNSLGNVIINVSNSNKINISKINPGIYWLIVVSGETRYNKKIIIN